MGERAGNREKPFFIRIFRKAVYINMFTSFTETTETITLELLKGKIHRARITMCDVDYELTSFAGAVGTRARTASWSSNNYYYSGSGKGVTYINDNYNGATFQDKVIAFAQDMGVSHSEIVQFQNDMLE